MHRMDSSLAASSPGIPACFRAAVVARDSDLRDTLAAALTARGHRVRVFADRDACLADALSFPAECVVIELGLPDLAGFTLLQALGRAPDPPAVVMLSDGADVSLAVSAMKLGAADFLLLPCDTDRLAQTVEQVCADRRRRRRGIDPQARALIDGLPERQKQVLRGIIQGKSSKIIARDLGLSPRTVETYRSRILDKFGDGVARAVHVAMAAGFE